jgi:tetratricopeptide (TPR) repeat protein
MARFDRSTAPRPVFPAERKGPWRVFVDLLQGGHSFRGFFEFTFIGAIVLAFLHGFNPDLSGLWRALLPGDQSGVMRNGANVPAGSGIGSIVDRYDEKQNQPHLPPTPLLKDVIFSESYFSGAEDPLRQTLKQASRSYAARDYQKTLDILADVDPDDPRVLLVRAVALMGLSDSKNFQSGVDLLDRAIAQGEPKAMAILGVLKFVGFFGLRQDLDGGRRLLEQAATAGDAAAARIVGNGYSNGWAGAVDLQRAATFMRVAADQNDAQAMYLFAKMLAEGNGVAKDQAESERLMLKAAQAGLAGAQFAVGMSNLRSLSGGVTSNPEPALKWLNLAAAQGSAPAKYTLGLFYLLSNPATGYSDPQRGVEYLRQCLEITVSAECAFAYADAFAFGRAGTRDRAKAYAFFQISEDAKPASVTRERLKEFAGFMTPEEIARAQANAIEIRQQLISGAKLPTSSGAPSRGAGAQQIDLDRCNGKNGTTVDQKISGCTVLIDSGAVNGRGAAGAFNNRGMAYQDKSQIDRAIQDFNQSIGLDPDNARAFNNRGRAYDAKGEHDRAIEDYDQAVRLDPALSDAFNNRGIAYQRKDQFERAIADYDQALQLEPNSVKALNNRGNAYKRTNQYDRAMQDFDQAIRINPNFAPALYNRGALRQLQGDTLQANVDFSKAKSLGFSLPPSAGISAGLTK